MIHRLLLIIVLCVPFCIDAQPYLRVQEFVFQSPIWSLRDDVPLFAEAFADITNVSDENLLVSIETEAIELPNSWEADDSWFKVLDGSYQLSPGGNFDLYIIIEELFISSYEGFSEKGTQQMRIRATSDNGTEVYNEVLTLIYEFEPLQYPSPTFQIFGMNDFLTPSDTIFIQLEVFPDEPTFFGFAGIDFLDTLWLDRYITLEPIEIISEHIDEINCDNSFNKDSSKSLCKGETIQRLNFDLFELAFDGTLNPDEDWRYELLVNIYDPLDSLFSNQQIRFIAVDANCENGTQANMLDIPSNEIVLCTGADTVLTTRPEFTDVTWNDFNFGTTIEGSSFEITNIQSETTIFITGFNSKGCLIFDFPQIRLNGNDNLIIQDTELSSYCPGEEVVLTINEDFTDPLWTNNLTGETSDSDSLVFTFEQEQSVNVEAFNSAGCLLEDDTFLPLNRGKLARIFPEDFYYICRGGSINLEANPEFTNVSYLNPSTEIITESTTIILENFTEAVNIEVYADSDDSCGVFQNIQFFPLDVITNNLMPQSTYTVCAGDSLRLEAASGFFDYRWFVRSSGRNIYEESIVLENVTEIVNIVLTATEVGGDGCRYKQEITVHPGSTDIPSPFILKTDHSLNFCEKVFLEAEEGFDEYAWSVFDENEYIIKGTGRTVDLDFTLDERSPFRSLKLEVAKNNGCKLFYEFIIHMFPEQKEIILINEENPYCEGDLIELSTEEDYEEYNWAHNGGVSMESTITVEASNATVSLFVEDDNGCLFTDRIENLIQLETPSLCAVSVDASTNNNIIYWEEPPHPANISDYIILRRSLTSNFTFDSIGIVEKNAETMFVDNEANTITRAHDYRVKAVNDCGYSSELSNIHLTSRLRTSKDENGILLVWGLYEGVEYEELIILRGSTATNLEEYRTFSSEIRSFRDDNPLNGDNFYQIEFIADLDCNGGNNDLTIRTNVSAEFLSDNIEELELSGKIYPNPFIDVLNLDLDYAITLELINTDGRTLKRLGLQAGTHRLDTSNLPQGIYVIRVRTEDQLFVQNFIKI